MFVPYIYDVFVEKESSFFVTKEYFFAIVIFPIICNAINIFLIHVFFFYSGADATQLNDRMQSPLHIAAELNKVEALKVFAKYRHSLDPNLGGEHGRTPLHIAAISDHEECMRILVSTKTFLIYFFIKKPDNLVSVYDG